MNLLYVHERPHFFGGVEQSIADGVAALRQRGIECHLAYSPQYRADQKFLRLFDSSHACSELGGFSDSSAGSLHQIATTVSARCLFFHKVERLPGSLDLAAYRAVQMVHDHDLCCPRKHKYFAWHNRVCHQPAGWRCYADVAFLERRAGNFLNLGFLSVGDRLKEMRRRHSLHAFLAASEFMRYELHQNGFPENRIYTLPLGGKHCEYITAPPIHGIPTVLYVGQLIKGKGVDLLLRALAQLSFSFRAVIVGRGNAEQSMRELCVKLHIEDKVEFRGWIDHGDLESLYNAAQVVAVPSRWPEPYGLVGIEAMMHGRAVIGFDVGGIRDWLRHDETGFLVPAQDVLCFARALETVLKNRELALRMGANGLAVARREYSFDLYVDRLEKILFPHRVPLNSDAPAEVYP